MKAETYVKKYDINQFISDAETQFVIMIIFIHWNLIRKS